MISKKFLTLIVIVLMFNLLVSFSLADTDTGLSCTTHQDCTMIFVENSYCESSLNTCFLTEDEDVVLPEDTTEIVEDTTPIVTTTPATTISEVVESTTTTVTETTSTDDYEYYYDPETGQYYYYDPATEEYYLYESDESENIAGSAVETDYNTTTTSYATTSTVELENRIIQLEEVTNTLQSIIAQIDDEMANSNQELGSLKTAVIGLENQMQQEINSMSTGLAGLQENLKSTNSQLQNVESDLEQEQKFSEMLKIIFYILLAIVFSLLVIYFINRRRKKKLTKQKPNPQIMDYITRHIKKGDKYPQIKNNLMRAGWNEQEINWAYRETLRYNYKKYIQKKRAQDPQYSIQKTSKKKNSQGIDHRKIWLTLAFVVFLLIAILLVARGFTSTGQAINVNTNELEQDNAYFNKLVYSKLSNEITRGNINLLTKENDICIEVINIDQISSYNLNFIGGNFIEEIAPCQKNNHDKIIIFNTFSEFNTFINCVDNLPLYSCQKYIK